MGGLLLLRHAESTWNASGRWQGWADPPLSPAGLSQVRRAATRLATEPACDLIVASDLVRARQTAETLNSELGWAVRIAVEPGLREFDAGEWSGRTRAEIEQRWPGMIEGLGRGEVDGPPGGERMHAFEERVHAAGQRVAEAAAAAGVKSLLVITHGGVIRALARRVGLTESRAKNLAGFRGRHDRGGLFPEEKIDLLNEPNPPAQGRPAQIDLNES